MQILHPGSSSDRASRREPGFPWRLTAVLRAATSLSIISMTLRAMDGAGPAGSYGTPMDSPGEQSTAVPQLPLDNPPGQGSSGCAHRILENPSGFPHRPQPPATPGTKRRPKFKFEEFMSCPTSRSVPSQPYRSERNNSIKKAEGALSRPSPNVTREPGVSPQRACSRSPPRRPGH
jgi:hypothetical protein